MYLELGKEPIRLNHVDILKDVKLNLIPERHAFRLMFTYVGNEAYPERTVDINVFNYSNVQISTSLRLSIDLRAEEKITHKRLYATVSYSFIKRSFNISGTYGGSEIDITASSFLDLCLMARSYLI